MRQLVKFCALALVFVAARGLAEESAKKTTTVPQVTTVNKPVINAVKTELHQHPTLLRMLGRNNDMRKRVGLRAHRIDPQLTKAAQDHAVYMARTGGFSHYSNGGPQSRAAKYGFRGMVRENIAMGQPSVDSAFNTWQNSGGHWASIVSSTNAAGFGYARSANGQGYWVAVYGNVAESPAKTN